MMKHRGWRAVLAAVLAVTGIMVFAQSASALDIDCFPGTCSGYYQSSDGGARGGWDASPELVNAGYDGGEITWNGSGPVYVDGNLKDVLADGDGPVLLIDFYNGSVLSNTLRWHWTGGYNTSHHYDSTFNGLDFGEVNSTMHSWDGIGFRMCNGVWGSGITDVSFCTAEHGPFHM